MKIYISHSGNYDYESELYQPIKASELYKKHDIFLPHESQNINVNLKDILSQIDVLVAEVSLPSTGQGIELGRADAAGISIMCFYKEGSKPTSSLRFITNNVFSYSTIDQLLGMLMEQLRSLKL